MTEVVRWSRVETDLGRLLAARTERGLGFIALSPRDDLAELGAWRDRRARGANLREDGAALADVARELREYARGARSTFALPLDLRGTEFQLRVYAELLRIQYGQTITYAELARRLGDPRATRAVGAANGANPLPIVVPCHRVVATGGGLGGYGGGLALKARLLALEGVLLPVSA